ncbi:hypothetical protein CMUS01_12568 [Colletotrichum musicola]|uniref:BZIP domain-containing protein n=1 Tax=Colletotrichum musicola TaxID=2175873 RepID=A0A8H6JKB0_9PEZI|nr:hypothetical protein CMUS01_12568 [Colletotrichum musicola]
MEHPRPARSNPDPERKGRGRPRKEPSRSDKLNASLQGNRREKNRVAQSTFRQRQKTIEQERRQEVEKLEKTIDQIVSTFSAFAENVVESKWARQDMALMDNLRKSMNHVRSVLCQEPEASGDSLQGDPPVALEKQSLGLENGDDQTRSTQPSQSQTTNGGSSDSGHDSAMEVQHDTSDSDNKPSSSTRSDRDDVYPRLQENLFGNGWLSQRPVVSHISPSQYKQSTEGKLDSPFSVHITLRALRSAYDDLWSTMDLSTPVIRQKFGHVLQYKTREEVLFTLRWCLGPGIAEIGRLAMAPFDQLFGIGGDYGGAFPSASDALPMAPEISAVERRGHLRNANDVAKWLRQQTLAEVDEDILELELGVISSRQDGDLNGYATPVLIDHSRERWFRMLQPVRVSKDLFLQNICEIGFCLHIGPAFWETELERAIQKTGQVSHKKYAKLD